MTRSTEDRRSPRNRLKVRDHPAAHAGGRGIMCAPRPVCVGAFVISGPATRDIPTTRRHAWPRLTKPPRLPTSPSSSRRDGHPRHRVPRADGGQPRELRRRSETPPPTPSPRTPWSSVPQRRPASRVSTSCSSARPRSRSSRARPSTPPRRSRPSPRTTRRWSSRAATWTAAR